MRYNKIFCWVSLLFKSKSNKLHTYYMMLFWIGKVEAGDEHWEEQAAAPEGAGGERWGDWRNEIQNTEESKCCH